MNIGLQANADMGKVGVASNPGRSHLSVFGYCPLTKNGIFNVFPFPNLPLPTFRSTSFLQ